MLARVGASVAEYNALIDGVLSLRRFVNTINGGLGYAVVETEAWESSQHEDKSILLRLLTVRVL